MMKPIIEQTRRRGGMRHRWGIFLLILLFANPLTLAAESAIRTNNELIAELEAALVALLSDRIETKAGHRLGLAAYDDVMVAARAEAPGIARERRRELLRRIDAAKKALQRRGLDVAALETFLETTLAGGTTDARIADAGVGQGSMDRAVMAQAARSTDLDFLSRGQAWVRANPLFINGLNVSMGMPAGEFVDQYFDGFNANAVHLWISGLPFEAAGWVASGHPDARWVSWLRADGTAGPNGEVIAGLGVDPPGRIGYQVSDEPRNLWELQRIKAGIDTVRGADPEALLIVNFSLDPEEIDAMLQYFEENVDADIVSYDDYTRSQEAYASLQRIRDVGLRSGMPYWRYLRAFERAGESDWPTESDMRWNAFSGLVYGYTGHSWFIYQIRDADDINTAFFQETGDVDSAITPRFGYAARINTEMENLGSAINRLTSTDVRYLSSIGFLQPEGTEDWRFGAGGDPHIVAIDAVGGRFFQDLLTGFFENDRRERYFMIQNVNHSGGEFPAWGSAATDVELLFDFSGADPAVDKNRLQVVSPLTGLFEKLPLEPLGGERRRLRINLGAGDPILLKYRTYSSIGIRVDGIKPALAACWNRGTDQLVVTEDGFSVLRCGDEAFMARAGETVMAGMLGFVNPPTFANTPGLSRQQPITGSVADLQVREILCQNDTTGQTLIIEQTQADWDCSAAGLGASEGDQVVMIVTGEAAD